MSPGMKETQIFKAVDGCFDLVEALKAELCSKKKKMKINIEKLIFP